MDGTGPSVDWEYVAFPAPGYFPSDFFGRRYQWIDTLSMWSVVAPLPDQSPKI